MKGKTALSLACVILGIALVWSLRQNGSKEPVPIALDSEGTAAESEPAAGSPSMSRDTEFNAKNEDVISLLTQAFDETREIRSMTLFMAAMAVLDPGTLPAFRRFFSNRSLKNQQVHYWKIFYSAWGEFDGEGAIAHIKQRFDDVNVQRLFFASVAKTWKDHDPDGSIQFAAAFLPVDGSINGQLALDFINDLAKTDIDQAIAYGIHLNDAEFVMELTAERIKDLLKQDFNTAVSALETLEGDNRAFATSEFISEWSKTAPAMAANFLSENYYSEVGINTLSAIAANYVKADPVAAMEWVNSLPNDSSSAQLLANTVSAWTSADPEGVAAWLSASGSSKELDPAIVAYTANLASYDPSTALEEWVPRITDQNQSDQTLYELAMKWYQSDPDEFANWIANTETLGPIQKERMLAREYHGIGRNPNAIDPRGFDAATRNAPLNNGRDIAVERAHFNGR